MGKLRRSQLMVGSASCLAITLMSCQSPQAASAPQLPAIVITNGKLPGSFGIKNEGTATVMIDRKVTVEIWVNGKWNAITGVVHLIDRCDDPQPKECLRVAPGNSFNPLPWTGSSCAAQCSEPCRANEYYGPGRFRYVIHDCSMKQQWTGPEFQMPASPADVYKEKPATH